MTTPLIVGTATGVASGLAQHPEIEWSVEDNATCTVKWAGPYTGCLSAVMGDSPTFVRGAVATIEGVSGMTLSKIAIKKSGGARGLITVTYSKKLSLIGSEAEGYSEEDPTYECEWTEVSKAIELHPRYTQAKDLTGGAIAGAVAITTAGFAFVKAFFEADEARRLEMYGPYAGSGGELDTYPEKENIKNLIEKKLRGQDSFVLYSPLIRAVSVINGMPSSSNCGLRVTPPAGAHAPSNYVYLQTADRTAPNGGSRRFTRTIEYTGADVIDADIYPAAGV